MIVAELSPPFKFRVSCKTFKSVHVTDMLE